jgi:hypothetical protein
MYVIASLLIASLVGVAAITVSVAILAGNGGDWLARLCSRSGQRALGVLTAGCFLVLGAQCSLLGLLDGPAKRTEAGPKLRSIRQGPLSALRLQITGPDPFADHLDSCALEFQFNGSSRPNPTCMLSAKQMSLIRPAGRVIQGQVTLETEGSHVYTIPWQAVVDASATPGHAAVLGRIKTVDGLRQLRSLRLTILEHSTELQPPPSGLMLAVNDYDPLTVFVGQPQPQEVTQHSSTWAYPYTDDAPIAIRIDTWDPMQVYDGSALTLNTFVTAGILLLAFSSSILPLGSRWRWALLSDAMDELRPIWISGLLILLVILVRGFVDLDEERLKKAQYLVVGTVFPLLALGLTLISRFCGNSLITNILESALAVLGVVVVALFVLQHFTLYALAFTIIQWTMLLALSLFSVGSLKKAEIVHGATASPAGGLTDCLYSYATVPHGDHPTSGNPTARLLVSFLITLFGWTLSIQLLHVIQSGESFVWLPAKAFEAWEGRTPYSFPALLCALFLVLVNFQPSVLSSRQRHSIVRSFKVPGDCLAILVLAVAAFRSDQLFRDFDVGINHYHWGAFVAPADAVRGGGWLLWDVPSIYGFLSILGLAVFPAGDVWHAFYLVNSFCIFLCASFLFFILRSLRSGPLNWGLSLALTLATVFILPGFLLPDDSNILTGPQPWPSVGSYRFLWVYALLGVLLWEFHVSSPGRSSWLVPWAGCTIWVIGSLWSVDSALFATTIWLPAYVYRVLHECIKSYAEHRSLKKVLITGMLRVLLPFHLLALALGLVVCYYLMVLGHAPEFQAFIEAATSFTSYSMDEVGPWILLLLFAATSTGALCLVRNGSTRHLGIAWGIWSAFWAASSYYVTKTDVNMLLCLSPVACTAIGLAIHVLNRQAFSDRWVGLVKTAVIPVLTVFLAGAFARVEDLVITARGIKVGYGEIKERLPVMDEPLQQLLRSAHVDSGKHLVFWDDALLVPEPWLPLRSWQFTLDNGISVDRLRVYVERFCIRVRGEGYLLSSKKAMRDPANAWFFAELRQLYKLRQVAHNDTYELLWCEFGSVRPKPGRGPASPNR